MNVTIPRIYNGSIKGKYTSMGEKLLNKPGWRTGSLFCSEEGSTEAYRKEVMPPELREKL